MKACKVCGGLYVPSCKHCNYPKSWGFVWCDCVGGKPSPRTEQKQGRTARTPGDRD